MAHVRALITVLRCTGENAMSRVEFRVPAVIRACNAFLNGVDRLDQLMSNCSTPRKERRLLTTLFTWLLDISVHNAY